MARAPLIQLSDISLTFGGNPIFSDLGFVVQTGDRLSLVGRNGSGKSTLMKVMAGLVEADTGHRVIPPGVSVGYMEQDPDLSQFDTLGDFALSALDVSEHYKVEIAAEGLKFDPDRPVKTASGGERRRAALAKLMAEDPELMLLDEPTNHLDIEAISWLETTLRESRNSFVVISHDRAFLTALTRATLWIDRGAVRRLEQGFGSFEAWRDKTWEEEDQQRHKLNRKIKAEARWRWRVFLRGANAIKGGCGLWGSCVPSALRKSTGNPRPPWHLSRAKNRGLRSLRRKTWIWPSANWRF